MSAKDVIHDAVKNALMKDGWTIIAMDNVAKHRQIIKGLLQKYAEVINQSQAQSVEAGVIFDDEHNHYILTTLGWQQKRRVSGDVVHIRLRDGKIWIEEDGLEHGIATDLLEAGVPKEDIVLAFHHPDMRRFTEFAVA